jgi:hypothetical protein
MTATGRSPARMKNTVVVDSYMTGSHVELLNHYFPENERDIAMRIVHDILEKLPASNSRAFGAAVAAEVRRVYAMLRYGMRDKPLLDPSETPVGGGDSAAGIECIFLSEALVLLALENRRLLPEQHPQGVH